MSAPPQQLSDEEEVDRNLARQPFLAARESEQAALNPAIHRMQLRDQAQYVYI